MESEEQAKPDAALDDEGAPQAPAAASRREGGGHGTDAGGSDGGGGGGSDGATAAAGRAIGVITSALAPEPGAPLQVRLCLCVEQREGSGLAGFVG